MRFPLINGPTSPGELLLEACLTIATTLNDFAPGIRVPSRRSVKSYAAEGRLRLLSLFAAGLRG